MKTTISILLIVLGFGLVTAQETKTTNQTAGEITLKERVIPVSGLASKEMQESLVAM